MCSVQSVVKKSCRENKKSESSNSKEAAGVHPRLRSVGYTSEVLDPILAAAVLSVVFLAREGGGTPPLQGLDTPRDDTVQRSAFPQQ